MQVGYRSSMSSPPAELSSIRNGPSSSRASCRQDGRPVTTTSALQEASADVTEASSSDSSSGSERPGRSSLRLMSAATLGIFALAATLVIASRTLEAGLPALVGDGQITGLDDVSRDEDVVVTFEVKTELPPLPQHKYSFEDEPVHLEGDAAFDLDTDLAKVPDPKCGEFRFSFCSESKGGAYFDPTMDACMPVTRGPIYVCNRSPNRFTSLHECHRDCVKASRPHRRCMATPQFSHCEKGLASGWWFSNGTACQEWRFPLGMCPARDSSVYATARECRDNCLRPRDKLHCCHVPEPQVCTPGQLKYPYFAVISYDGGFRCLEATASTLSGYQCLTGPNQFDTVDSCNSTCIDGRHD
ncbi:uncharacterized protein LOC144134439 [Amblyomma americanum]